MRKWKPYDLAVLKREHPYGVETNVRYHVVEIMSYETPTQTIMVRRVPTWVGTLIEVRTEFLQTTKVPASEKYLHYAKVASRFEFPTDMLRYDSCEPLNFTLKEVGDIGRTELVIDPSFGMDYPVIVRVGLSKPRWHEDRWRSFSTFIIPFRTEKIVQR